MAYVLGIDGGGTKTIALIADSEGKILGQGAAGSTNYHSVGIKQTIAELRKASENAISSAGVKNSEIKTACFGLAGVGRVTDQEILLPALRSLDIAEKLILKHDAEIALAGATECQPGVVIIAGTGAMAFGMNHEGKTDRCNGWGNILGDEGSAYYISRRALISACKAYDGRGAQTLLMDAFMKHLGLTQFTDIVKIIYNNETSTKEIASLAPLVSQAAESGDEVAISILQDAGYELALAANAVICKLAMQDDKFLVAKSGSVFNSGKVLLETFTKHIKDNSPMAEIINPRFDPAMGAVLLAIKEI